MFGKSKPSTRGKHSQSSSSKPKASKQDQNATTSPPVSFLFVVNQLIVNEDPDQRGVVPRENENGQWIPPIRSAGFRPQQPGLMFRCTDGLISSADGYQWYNGIGWDPSNIRLDSYRTTSMFWCNPWTQYLTADGDVSTRDMETAQFPDHRWHPLTFDHDGTLSRIALLHEHQQLAGSGASWVGPLGLSSYNNRRAPASTGLAGNLPMVIGLIAFSCPSHELNNVLLHDRAWRRYEWRGHNRGHGRDDRRGIVVTTYIDPENLGGSTSETLGRLEWSGGPLLR